VKGRREKTPTQLGPLKRANFNHWRLALSKDLRTETDSVSETSCVYSLKHRMIEKVQTPSNSVFYTSSSEPYNTNKLIVVKLILKFPHLRKENIHYLVPRTCNLILF
jgi:hypothetical protein